MYYIKYLLIKDSSSSEGISLYKAVDLLGMDPTFD